MELKNLGGAFNEFRRATTRPDIRLGVMAERDLTLGIVTLQQAGNVIYVSPNSVEDLIQKLQELKGK